MKKIFKIIFIFGIIINNSFSLEENYNEINKKINNNHKKVSLLKKYLISIAIMVSVVLFFKKVKDDIYKKRKTIIESKRFELEQKRIKIDEFIKILNDENEKKESLFFSSKEAEEGIIENKELIAKLNESKNLIDSGLKKEEFFIGNNYEYIHDYKIDKSIDDFENRNNKKQLKKIAEEFLKMIID